MNYPIGTNAWRLICVFGRISPPQTGRHTSSTSSTSSTLPKSSPLPWFSTDHGPQWSMACTWKVRTQARGPLAALCNGPFTTPCSSSHHPGPFPLCAGRDACQYPGAARPRLICSVMLFMTIDKFLVALLVRRCLARHTCLWRSSLQLVRWLVGNLVFL